MICDGVFKEGWRSGFVNAVGRDSRVDDEGGNKLRGYIVGLVVVECQGLRDLESCCMLFFALDGLWSSATRRLVRYVLTPSDAIYSLARG